MSVMTIAREQVNGSITRLCWIYLGLIAGAELLTSLVSPLVGGVGHALILVGLLACAALSRSSGNRKLAPALANVPAAGFTDAAGEPLPADLAELRRELALDRADAEGADVTVGELWGLEPAWASGD